MQLNMGVYVEGPSTAKQKVAGGGANQTLSGTFDAGSVPNGTFNVILKGEITGTTYATSTFKLRRPAAAPDNVAAVLEDAKKIVVTWSKGSEPDLQSYEVATSQSGIVGRLPADSACSGSSCKAVLAVPSKAAGQRVGFTVKAFRGDGDGGSIGSGNSGAAYVTVPAPPVAKPKKTATKQETPTTKKGVDTLPTLPGKKHTQPTAAPTRKATTTKNTGKLPAMPDTDPKGNLPIPTADTTGDSGKTDGLSPDGTKGDTESAPIDSKVKAQSSESPTGSIGQYGLYVAGGLVLLLLAAHGGAWARRRSLAGAAATAGGPGPHAAAASPSPGISPQHSTDSIPPTTTSVPRRPAVVLAVAKVRPASEHSRTQMPEQSRAPERPGIVQTPELSRTSERLGGRPQPQASGASRTPERSGAQVPARSRMQALEHPRSAASDRLSLEVSDQVGAGVPDRLGLGVSGQSGLATSDRLGQGVPDPSGSGAPDRSGAGLPDRSGAGMSDRSGVGVHDRPGLGVSGQFGTAAASDRFNLAAASDLPVTPSAAAWRSAEGPSVGRAQGPVSGAVRAEVRAVLPLHLSDADMGADQDDWVSIDQDVRAPADQGGWTGADRGAVDQGGRMRAALDGREVRQEPIRIALPSSAVIVVPESAAVVTSADVRIEERWDDYLPPSPRAMEDSGFWERPQPGAGDFWAADEDEDENAFAGHRHRGGDS
ncbi:hypothetical protein [Nonomuraea sp. NEAU-A123]|uniref:hypothetical protein n=1 Tax=Nonomuraea sp. NEAU-A123 TaxID=2839649 RepID=UPI001BE4CB6B|nr:hypothetical protein [Nonomuraea sp. NEAU-A123]MBT2225865.1 hypothetical protein [Nonomuraea sp. NEAU-A123]